MCPLWGPGSKGISYQGRSYYFFFMEENRSAKKGKQKHTIRFKAQMAKNVDTVIFVHILLSEASYMAKFNISWRGKYVLCLVGEIAITYSKRQ